MIGIDYFVIVFYDYTCIPYDLTKSDRTSIYKGNSSHKSIEIIMIFFFHIVNWMEKCLIGTHTTSTYIYLFNIILVNKTLLPVRYYTQSPEMVTTQ